MRHTPLQEGTLSNVNMLLTVDRHQVQYAVKRKLVEGSMSARRQQQLKEKEQMHFDLGSFKEKK